MKKHIILFFFLLHFLSDVVAQVHVQGYYRRDGTYVQPHYRSNPDGNPYNNWSYPGNVNPYTGKVATGNPDTYLKNYYDRTTSSNTNIHDDYRTTNNEIQRMISEGEEQRKKILEQQDKAYRKMYKYYSVPLSSYSNKYIYEPSYYTIGQVYNVLSKNLNLRNGPSTKHKIVMSLPEEYEVLVKQILPNGWLKVFVEAVDLNNNNETIFITGYVHSNYIY